MHTEWLKFAKNHNFKFILIIKDLEDRDEYPVYFSNYKDLIRFKENIISESKIINQFDV